MENNIETLSAYITRVMHNKKLTSYDVQQKSGNTIGQSYVVKLKNGDTTNISAAKLKALTKGLGVSEEEIFAIARGVSGEPSNFEQKLIYAAGGSVNWSDEQKELFIKAVRYLATGINAEI